MGLLLFISACLACSLLGLGWMYTSGQLDLLLMRFFRDLSRAKARSKLDNREGALAVILGRDEPFNVDVLPEEGIAFSEVELQHYRGQTDDTPIYLAIRGRVYDVTAGRSYYGPGRSYHSFVGRDATRAFGTGCTASSCLSCRLFSCRSHRYQTRLLGQLHGWAA